MRYETGVLVGRASSLANVRLSARKRPEVKLCELAAGDRSVIVLARARFREFLAEGSSSREEQQAWMLLHQAVELFDQGADQVRA